MRCCPGSGGFAEPSTETGRTMQGVSTPSPGWARQAADGQHYPLSRAALTLRDMNGRDPSPRPGDRFCCQGAPCQARERLDPRGQGQGSLCCSRSGAPHRPLRGRGSCSAGAPLSVPLSPAPGPAHTGTRTPGEHLCWVPLNLPKDPVIVPTSRPFCRARSRGSEGPRDLPRSARGWMGDATHFPMTFQATCCSLHGQDIQLPRAARI